ncbi:protein preY, mitochondrial [Coffea eugenioides]|uniref:Protein preY, mitochondrial n=1 Tax=Coffea arabica TaxID=13443 RepID=A0A6P6TH81_COFAR|nr:protein preY, mitochondrial [Coffea eugenioides]
MLRFGRVLFKEAGTGISKTLSEILVCPLSKQPLRVCEKTNSLISDSIGVSYPVVDGIPRLVPSNGKIIDDEEASNSNSAVDPDAVKNDHQRCSS